MQPQKRLRVTTERFIEESRKIHGDKYDYSKVTCSAHKDKVTITCKQPGHGDWVCSVNNHLRGSGCPVCGGNIKPTTESWVAKAREIHGDKYDYSKVSYTHRRAKVTIICPTHGEFEQNACDHTGGRGCPKCAGKGLMTTELFIAKAREIHGDRYDYSKAKFRTSTAKINILCKTHGIFEQSYSAHVGQKQGCPKCAGKQLKTTEQFISEAIAVHGDKYRYEKSVYVTSKDKLTVTCRKHGEFQITPMSHLAGQGCWKCFNESRTLTAEQFVKAATEVHNGKYAYDKVVYTQMKNKVTVTCPEHGDWEITAGTHLYSKIGCPWCSGNKHTTDSFIARAKAVHGDNYDYSKVDYVNYDTYVTITCKKHGDFQQSPDSHLQGKGCKRCANVGPSKGQLEVTDFLAQHTKVISEHTFEGSRKSFDIYLPNEKLAVEYDGIFWHSSRKEAMDTRDFEKSALGEKHGVRVIHIYEDEWYFTPDTVKNMLLSAIGKLPRLFARKCSIEYLEDTDVSSFYMDHHIQGNARCPVHIGLFHEGVLVACMSFAVWRSNRHNRDKRHWELVRYAASHTVVGGASKLLKAFIRLGVADRITSYSDVRMFSGKMYEKLGFTFVHQTPPDYQYTNCAKFNWREHKAKFQKSRLQKMFPGCDIENKTERQICEENGYLQIYDCGKIRWDLELAPNADQSEPSLIEEKRHIQIE